jgi:thiamine-phosphate pyrophosphorylase
MLPRPKILGLSTHDAAQIEAANESDADYIAIGPIFATSTKENPDAVIGVDGLARLRASARKPVVAIGGITRANFRSVVDAGADSVAVIGNLLADCTAGNLESQLTQNIRDFLD